MASQDDVQTAYVKFKWSLTGRIGSLRRAWKLNWFLYAGNNRLICTSYPQGFADYSHCLAGLDVLRRIIRNGVGGAHPITNTNADVLTAWASTSIEHAWNNVMGIKLMRCPNKPSRKPTNEGL